MILKVFCHTCLRKFRQKCSNCSLRVQSTNLTLFSIRFHCRSFGLGANGFKFLAKYLGQCCQNCFRVVRRIALKSFYWKETWSLKHYFPRFSSSRVSEESSELKSSCQKVKLRKILNFKEKKIWKFLLNLVQNFQQGCKMYIICMHRDLIGFVFFFGLRSNFVRTFADKFLSKLAELISKKLTFSKSWAIVFPKFW